MASIEEIAPQPQKQEPRTACRVQPRAIEEDENKMVIREWLGRVQTGEEEEEEVVLLVSMKTEVDSENEDEDEGSDEGSDVATVSSHEV